MKRILFNPVFIISMTVILSVFSIIFALFLPSFYCLIPVSIAITVLFLIQAFLLENNYLYKHKIKLVLDENAKCQKAIRQLLNERDFLMAVIEQYDIHNIN